MLPVVVSKRRHPAVGFGRSVMVFALGFALLGAATVNPAIDAPSDSEADSPTMGEYSLDNFRAAAGELDGELVEAVERDLELSAEQYLARSQAAADASEVVEYLISQGIDVEDRQLEDTQLLIGVGSLSQAEAVEAAGAVAVLGSLPQPKQIPDDVVFRATTDVYGGDGFSWNSSRCSVGVNGTNAALEPQLVTAGHCTSSSISNGGLYRHLAFNAPGFSPTAVATNIGAPRPGSFYLGGGYDSGILRVSQPGFTPQPYVTTYNGGQGARLGSVVAVRDTIIPILGAPVCKSGGTTGWTCGSIVAAAVIGQLVSNYRVDVFVTDACMLGGDSGGPAMVGNAFVGVNSGSAFGEVPNGYSGTPIQFCNNAEDQFSVMAIMRHTAGIKTIETAYGSSWETTVVVDDPTVTPLATYTSGAPLTVTGGISNPNPRTRIHVTVGGVRNIVTPNASTGAWTASFGSVNGTNTTVSVQARWGQRSSSTTVILDAETGGPWVARQLNIERIAGADRYDVAIGITQRAYPSPAQPQTVYVVNGGNYPDALSAGSAAAATGGVVMLVPSTSLLPKIRTELQRLAPQRIVIVGGPASVSTAVQNAMVSAVPGTVVSRISGADRFEVSRKVLTETAAFGTATNLYVANGYNYPDALVAGAAGSAASMMAPVLIVPGIFPTLPAETLSAIDGLGLDSIKIAGGPGSVTPGIQTQLSGLSVPSTIRLGGIDRFEAARSVANDAYPGTADTVFLTTGLNFPDALAGAPLAGLLNAPMYSVRTTCVPSGVLEDLARLRPTTIILLGGTGTLTPAVAALIRCP
jgi:putative cell wall-binding protein